MRLGKRQLELLRMVGSSAALIVPTPVSRRLCQLGLMREAMPDGMACITPDGLRALADAAEAGKIALFEMPEKPAGTPDVVKKPQ